jgi:lysyl-tRNA synthetase class 2
MADEATDTVRAIRYDAERRRLVVRFADGGEVAYVGVPGEVHRSFAEASSKRRFLEAEIDGRYPYNRLI